MLVQPLSESTEMYLKAMLELSDREVMSVVRLAERLNVTAVSANEMLRRLVEQGWVEHIPYKGVTLTANGREAACSVIRRQRLWECFLYEQLKIEWSKLYELACSLEHATAPDVTAALAVFLGNPKTCPHGNPIPAADGTLMPLDGVPLTAANVGETVCVVAVSATATDVLRHLQERKILPGQVLSVLDAAPLEGPLTLREQPGGKSNSHRKEIVLGLSLAEFVIVKGCSHA